MNGEMYEPNSQSLRKTCLAVISREHGVFKGYLRGDDGFKRCLRSSALCVSLDAWLWERLEVWSFRNAKLRVVGCWALDQRWNECSEVER